MDNVVFNVLLLLKVLQIQNKKLSERLKERNYNMEQLHGEVLQLKTAQSDNQQKMLILKQFWDSIDAQIISGLDSLGVSHEIIQEDFTKQLVTLNSTQLRLVCQERYDHSKEHVLLLLKHLESEVNKLSDVTANPNISQALETELTIWRKRNEKRMTSSHPTSDTLRDTNTLLKEQISQLESNLADAKFDLHKHQTRAERLERQLSDVIRELHNKSTTSSSNIVSSQDTLTTATATTVTTAVTSSTDNNTMVTSNPTTGELPKTELVSHMMSCDHISVTTNLVTDKTNHQ